MKLTEEEAVAIRFHMGAYEGEQIWGTLGEAFKKYPLALHLHIADMKATYLK
jgi:3'-5' exoribonuclease